ncbi:MAG: hypothetical protein A2Y15_06170 [Clostridiales bacterium GWF2_36_10]|nr:MAG: hypothetical protein A2Y15_06170 [Clostridiales bacterium GWF2_36_10]HAN21898.1 hypothetical protein [Clostridiales bacterium]
MFNLKRKLCLLLALLFCFAFFASCTDDDNDGDTSGSAESNGFISDDDDDDDDLSDIITDDQEESDIVSDYSIDVTDESPDVSIGEDLSEINAFPMTFTKVSDALYRMECVAPDGNTLFLTFDKKDWGTYNIGTWTVKDDKGKSVNLAGGGTDWEYVFRAGETATTCDFSGGNHGKELLVDIDFYDGETNKKLNLKDNTPVKLNNIKIVEKTKLHWGDVNKTYCDVVRTYHVVGSQITLDVSFKYTKDCYKQLSYTCMFPVDKKYGLYCAFVDSDNNVIDVIETTKVGKADYTGPFLGQLAADRCVIWGYVNPNYKFDINVTTVTDSCDDFKNSYKTFYWDMNITSNKLYFSKYDSQTATLVKAGSEFNTHSAWTFYVD